MNQQIFRQLILSSRKNRGVALPIALCLGVIVTAVAVAMIANSSAERSKTTTQKVKAEGLSIAEVAIAQIQNLIDANRLLTMYDEDYWSNLNTPDPLNPKNPAYISFRNDLESETTKNIIESNNCRNGAAIGATEMNSQIQSRLQTIQAIGSRQWQDLPNGQGSYRLITYRYQGTPGSVTGTQTGILTVEGRVGRDNSQSTSRVNVALPVIQQPRDSIFSGPQIPGLWIARGATNDATQSISASGYNGGANFNANVVMSDRCSFTPAQQTGIANFITANRIDPVDGNSGYQAKFVNEQFPDLPPMPTSLPTAGQMNLTIDRFYNGPKTSTEVEENDPQTGRKVKNVKNSFTFPRASDVSTKKTTIGGDEVDVYEYVVEKIDLNGSDTITITPGRRVIFYVKGNIGGNGNGGIEHNCAGVANCAPTNVQIFAYNTSNSASPEICLKGNPSLYAFIFAPNYSIGKTGQGDFYGSVWGSSWGKIQTCGSNNGNTAVVQQGEWSKLYNDLRPDAPLPKIGSVTAWNEVATDSAVPSPVAITNP